MPIVHKDHDPFVNYAARPSMGTWAWGRKRHIQANDHGRGVVGMIDSDGEFYQGDPESVPRVPESYRWGGLCEFLPQPWAERVAQRVSRYQVARALCLSCGMQSKQMGSIAALAWASDHDHRACDHQIVLLHGSEVIARNTYSPLSATQSCGEQHRRDMQQRREALQRWQRTIR